MTALAACAEDPTLEVVVVHDPTYKPLITNTVVSVYETDGLTCTQIEFEDISDDVLAGAVVASGADGDALTNISRTAHKVIVARGYAVDNSLVTAGCAELDLISGADSITVTTVATVTVTVGTGAEHGILVTTTDALNQSVDNRQVYWRVYGAAGTSADPTMYSNTADGVWEPLQPSCTTDGDVTIHPVPPVLPGAFGVQLRISWPTKPVPLLTSFTPFNASTGQVSIDPA